MARVAQPTIDCPKCGDNRWTGPRFQAENLTRIGSPIEEALLYTCQNCQYSHATHTISTAPDGQVDPNLPKPKEVTPNVEVSVPVVPGPRIAVPADGSTRARDVDAS
jgi:hypothetical protein